MKAFEIDLETNPLSKSEFNSLDTDVKVRKRERDKKKTRLFIIGVTGIVIFLVIFITLLN